MAVRSGRGFLYLIGFLLLVLLILFIVRKPILRALGNYLIYENDLQKTEAMFVLSGSPYDRGREAARLYKEDFAERIVCVGENVPHNFKVLDIQIIESELTKLQLIKSGVSDESITVLPKGTSTLEESDHILQYCRENGFAKVMVVSSKFHTRRIKQVFKKKFSRNGIEVVIRGAPSSEFNEQTWWENEYGLLFVNNEYVKQLYYLFK